MNPGMQSCVERLFQLSDDMFCQAERDGRFLYVDPSWNASLGWSTQELLSMDWRDLVHPDDEEVIEAACRESRGAEYPDHSFMRCKKKDGAYFWSSWRVEVEEEDMICAVVRQVDESTGIGNGHSISSGDLQEMKEAHKSALKELEILVYTVSHDVRAPIRQIIQFADMATDALTHGGAEEAAYFVSRIGKISRNTSQLLVDLLWFSQASNAPLEKDNCDLGRLALETLAEISNRHPGRRIDIKVDDDMRVRGDWRLLRILFNNLIGNACKFTADREVAVINVGRSEVGGQAVFSVRDNGVGFDSARAEDLFTPFVRAHSDNRFKGTGIGLATARRIVERHGGKIWAESGGDGAVFSFTLGEDCNSPE